jgi:uncharacterized protein (TIGR02452 family)
MSRDFNLSIVNQNLKLSHEKHKNKILNSISYTKKFDVETLKINPVKYQNPAIVTVIFQDTADEGYFLQQNGFNPVILNMASEKNPGGGWRNGAIAQEESLFYRSTYHLSLENKKLYPIEETECIYTPDFYFLRSNQKNSFALLKDNETFFLSCIAMPAIRKPYLIEEKYQKEDEELMLLKMDGIMKTAIKYGHDSVVLGSMGAGAFGNPPEQVALLFKQIVNKYLYNFKRISFAILDFYDKDGFLKSKNFDIFSKIILN